MTARTTWTGPAGRLTDATPASVGPATAGFTPADWARIEDEHLDIIGLRLFGALEELGIDMDEDPIAVFCRLYLDARSARLADAGPTADWQVDQSEAAEVIRRSQPPGRFNSLYAHEAAMSMVTALVRDRGRGAETKVDAVARVCDALEEIEVEAEL